MIVSEEDTIFDDLKMLQKQLDDIKSDAKRKFDREQAVHTCERLRKEIIANNHKPCR